MPRKVLESSSLVEERDAINVAGVEYEIRGPGDMTIRLTEQLDVLQVRREEIILDADSGMAELKPLMFRLFEIIFIEMPPEDVLNNSPYTEIEGWMDFFTSRSETRATAALAEATAKDRTRRNDHRNSIRSR